MGKSGEISLSAWLTFFIYRGWGKHRKPPISNQIDGSTCAMMLQLQNGKLYITMGVTAGGAEAIKHNWTLQPFSLGAVGTQFDAVERRNTVTHNRQGNDASHNTDDSYSTEAPM